MIVSWRDGHGLCELVWLGVKKISFSTNQISAHSLYDQENIVFNTNTRSKLMVILGPRRLRCLLC